MYIATYCIYIVTLCILLLLDITFLKGCDVEFPENFKLSINFSCKKFYCTGFVWAVFYYFFVSVSFSLQINYLSHATFRKKNLCCERLFR